jgi:hypothetical protein
MELTKYIQLVGKLQHKKPFHHSAILICHCPLRCVIVLTRQHIIIFPMFKSETSFWLVTKKGNQAFSTVSSFRFPFSNPNTDRELTPATPFYFMSGKADSPNKPPVFF